MSDGKPGTMLSLSVGVDGMGTPCVSVGLLACRYRLLTDQGRLKRSLMYWGLVNIRWMHCVLSHNSSYIVNDIINNRDAPNIRPPKMFGRKWPET